jgi:protein-disulfide isomerase
LLKPPLSERDHVLGSPTAGAELVEYGDFECPHCARAAVVVEQLRAELGGQLRFAFRHFPLAKMHPHARKAAQATEAAAVQGGHGKFWEMHNVLFRNPSAMDLPHLLDYAGQMQLDVGRFESELHADTYAARVQEDITSGVRSGVNGTPTFFINGKRHNGGYDIDALRAAIDSTE